MTPGESAEVERRFTYHPPVGDQPTRYERLRGTAREFAALLMELCPASPERRRALDHVDYAVMAANASIARHTPTALGGGDGTAGGGR
ncbi:hypothetical protein OG896_24430 [Streptomyces sp. NBC_00669]|uniref:Acb2/Tad1 domain-containing protein n=1 Tax=Streptomyces sp. NBC_00669 TaxID=2976011 RepID=UPI002E32A69D|nr:hypothetical protein [Streptomyces sp. NBC_00669]